MFKRLLTLWIIFTTLGYSAVWALDLHAARTGTHHHTTATASLTADIPSDQQPIGDHPDCDHCGHASAHLLALNTCTSGNLVATRQSNTVPYLSTPRFFPALPLERPPKS